MKYKMKLWVIAFAFIIFCIPVIWMIAGKYMDDENYENRSIAERPVFSLDTIEDYPAAYETYYNDHLPFRNQLIQLNSRIEYYIFQHSSNQSVIKGKESFVFLRMAVIVMTLVSTLTENYMVITNLVFGLFFYCFMSSISLWIKTDARELVNG